MRTKTEILRHINITRFARYVVFGTCDIAPEIETKAKKGLDCIEKIVAGMFTQDMLPYAIQLSDVAEIIGISSREAKRCIANVLKLGYDSYDGVYGRPELKPEHAVYLVAALVIHEYGRKAGDLVKYKLDGYLDISAIATGYDMACYIFLIEYFERCFEYGKTPITKYLKENSNGMVTSARIMHYIANNDWYGNNKAYKNNFETMSPKLSEIANVLFENLKDDLEKEKELLERYELHKAFDNPKA